MIPITKKTIHRRLWSLSNLITCKYVFHVFCFQNFASYTSNKLLLSHNSASDHQSKLRHGINRDDRNDWENFSPNQRKERGREMRKRRQPETRNVEERNLISTHKQWRERNKSSFNERTMMPSYQLNNLELMTAVGLIRVRMVNDPRSVEEDWNVTVSGYGTHMSWTKPTPFIFVNNEIIN